MRTATSARGPFAWGQPFGLPFCDCRQHASAVASCLRRAKRAYPSRRKTASLPYLQKPQREASRCGSWPRASSHCENPLPAALHRPQQPSASARPQTTCAFARTRRRERDSPSDIFDFRVRTARTRAWNGPARTDRIPDRCWPYPKYKRDATRRAHFHRAPTSKSAPREQASFPNS